MSGAANAVIDGKSEVVFRYGCHGNVFAAGKLIGATVQDIDTRKKYGLNIVAIERDHRTDTDFSPQFRFESGDIISVIGRTDRIEKFESDIQAGD